MITLQSADFLKESSSDKKLRAGRIVAELKKLYPFSACSLDYKDSPWKLMVMARLSAQCTDKCVNKVCETLFAEYHDAKALAGAEVSDVEKIIKPCGLFRVKARDIIAECSVLAYDYGGVLPDEVDILLGFPGIGRKIANLLVSDIYGKPAIVADTHCIRISGRLGLTPDKTANPYLVEKTLTEIIDGNESASFCHRLVLFGREICTARSPKCEKCPLRGLCPESREA